MIAPLQRQHIRRRQRIALRMRARSRHARPRGTRRILPAKIARRPRPRLPVSHRSRPGALRRLLSSVARLFSRAVRRRPRIAAVPSPAPRPRAATTAATAARRRAPDARSLRLAILFAGTLVLATLLVLAGTGTIRLPGRAARVDFPVTDAADLEMMQLMLPEEPEVPVENLPGPKTLKTFGTSVYTVRSGDSVSGIAQKFGLAIDTVLSWNAIRDAHLVVPGKVLTLPNADGLRYAVRRGDTLEGIAKRNGILLTSILDWNDLGTSTITPGQVLFLPGARMPAGDIARALGTLFVWPLKGKLTSRFGMRVGPVDGIDRMHWGIDIKGDTGTPILAAMEGTVYDVGYNSRYGKYIILRHSGFQTLYGHLSRFSVEKGESVAQGRKIGEVGSTGVSTGPHLHFGVYVKGEPVDPQRYLK
jgi:murein DD-endopeptidase MepM/ murein hydrolase activator NlpD